jgi:hypothetical protein
MEGDFVERRYDRLFRVVKATDALGWKAVAFAAALDFDEYFPKTSAINYRVLLAARQGSQ